jgi:subtilase family serine protease
MRRSHVVFIVILFVILLSSLIRGRAAAQDSAVPSRITAAIDNSKLTVLRGNTHPFARAAFDRGAAADSLQMDQMLLVLQRGATQQATLEKLLAAQQDKNSPSYHQWLSPDEFGRQFGASDADIQKISAWLESQGFQVNSVSHGRDLINFSGNAAQIRNAFHTTIHQYVVNGRNHISNASDPAIPTALAPVVAGVRSLNDFFPTAKHRATAAHGMTAKINPHLTLTDADGNTFFGVGPTDFATIYGILPLWNAPSAIDGNGVTIAIVSGSDINTTDVSQFRTIFGLPTIKFTRVVPTGSTDPGIVGPTSNGGPDGDEDETEAVFDVEWSGAVAKNANIDLVASKDTATSAGIDLSAVYIVDNDFAPILSESYGACELAIGTSGNAFYANLWGQAAAEGITVSISSGDNGSSACDILGGEPNPTTGGQQEGVFGLGVNGIASTPYNVAVGGTDFNDHVTPNSFWSSSNVTGTLNSAQSYVPELAWNDTCTNSLIYTAFLGSTATAAEACNSTAVQDDGNNGDTADGGFFFVAPTGGSGGKSSCTTAANGANETSECSGGYAKPSWQTGVGVPADGKRDLPDVSFFAESGNDSYGLEVADSDKVPGSFYFACEEDLQGQNGNSAACSTSGAFLLGGGTSISAQVFAGVMALIDEKTASSQGNINSSFYSLAAGQSTLNCNSSSTTTPPNSACIFHDVTVGTNAMPCQTPSTHDGTSDCSTAGGGPIGILTGYTAGTGYDQVTGLGSINVANLAGAMPYLSIAASPTTVTVSGPGQSGSTTLTFTANNGFSATIDALACSNLPKGASCSFTENGSAVSSLMLNNATTTASVTLTVNTTAASGAVPAHRIQPSLPGTGVAVALLGAMLGGIVWLFARGEWRKWAPAAAIFAFGLLLATAGCSGSASLSGSGNGGGGTGGSGGTPPGTTTTVVSVTNTANNAVMSYDLTLTVDN